MHLILILELFVSIVRNQDWFIQRTKYLGIIQISLKEAYLNFNLCDATVSELVGADQFKDLFTRANLQCRNPVEIIYYSVGYVTYCTHCGSRGNLSNAKNEYPMCDAYKKNKSNKPLARRQAFTKSTSKK